MSQDQADAEFEELLNYLRRARGFDFTGYKRASLLRRVAKRMHTVGVPRHADYQDYLEVHPEEFAVLFDTILINVTDFFRDPEAWEALRAEIVPRLVAGKRPEEPIRVWSAGCASGEEAYSLAMALAEAIGVDQARERVKIYATDVDEDALTRARHASYDERHVRNVPPDLLARYFEPIAGRYVFQKDLRRAVIFGRHDLVQDAPISRIDLLSCRNTLMYFNGEAQARIFDRLHFALNDRGALFLGKAETLLTYNHAFTPVDLARRIFAKVPRGNLRDRLMVMARASGDEAADHLVSHVRVRETAFDKATLAQLVVDSAGLLALANERARAQFGLAPSDLGRPLQDLQVSYQPADLRSALDLAYVERRPVILADVEWPSGPGDPGHLEVHVLPLLDANETLLGAAVTFLDVTATRRLREDLQTSHRELETAYEELQSTNEELETTNEELQSTVEELETTNEELQSTNEELETMNEELQSTNEELETVNDELRRRDGDLNRVNHHLESILGSLRGGVAVVDPEFLVHVWNAKAEDLWGIRPDEARGKNLLSFDIGLPVDQLRSPIRACVNGEAAYQELHLSATNRKGRPIRCRVTCTPMTEGDGPTGAILVMEESDVRPPDGFGSPAAVDGEVAR